MRDEIRDALSEHPEHDPATEHVRSMRQGAIAVGVSAVCVILGLGLVAAIIGGASW